ncbi:MAG: D-glycero-D-manno-heptose 1,7-bisphosphate phosphatase [Verrucomicrobiales bacterium]|jgi:D-glycero-D-manno-heptose 1,7-bisphosphate phosphatase
MSRPCIFFDRDGVVNLAPSADEYYVLSPERLFIQPAWLDALAIANQKGYAAVIVTNQKCVHKDLLTDAELEGIHQVVWEAVHTRGLVLDGIYSATRGDEDPDAKPKPGMLLKAAAEHDLDLQRSWMIGDSERDIEAGRRAGVAETVLIGLDFTLEALCERLAEKL